MYNTNTVNVCIKSVKLYDIKNKFVDRSYSFFCIIIISNISSK